MYLIPSYSKINKLIPILKTRHFKKKKNDDISFEVKFSNIKLVINIEYYIIFKKYMYSPFVERSLPTYSGVLKDLYVL